MTARVPREHASRFHKHLTLRFDEYERSRFPDTMDILNELTEEEFNHLNSYIRRLSGIAMMWEDVSDRNDPRVHRLLEDAARSAAERERRENERTNDTGIFWIISRVAMLLSIKRLYLLGFF